MRISDWSSDVCSSDLKWSDSWGAIASDGNGAAGIATAFPSKRKAKKGAISECKKRGGGKCTIWRTFMNQCAAVIAGEGPSATAHAPTKREAIARGKEKCRRAGGGVCRWYLSGFTRTWGVW